MHHDASLNIRQLQVFEAVARLESYSRAQQELGISVSAISNAMSQLEGQLGFTLCQRGRGGFSLTEKGQQFLQQAIRVLSELNELERQSALLKGEHSGTLCISTLDSIETETALSLPGGSAQLQRQISPCAYQTDYPHPGGATERRAEQPYRPGHRQLQLAGA